MAECIVIADDLTGANATGVLLRKMEYRTVTILNREAIDKTAKENSDCLLYPTDSRAVSQKEAYRRVHDLTAELKSPDVKVYAKRIDSTLRGNLGSETDAMLDALGKDYIAVCAPCFPSSGRIVIGGYMLVKGIPLHKTEAALDPKAPVHSSQLQKIMEEQSKYHCASIDMKDMMDGKHVLAEVMMKKIHEGARILCFDCITDADLDLIADAVIHTNIRFVSVDPGPFTATMARKLIAPRPVSRTKSNILAVVGSVNPIAREQLEDVWLSQRTCKNILAESAKFLADDKQREAEISRICREVQRLSESYRIITIATDGIYPENRIDLAGYADKNHCTVDQASNRINDAFAEIVYRVFQSDPRFKGLYTSGGDITVAVCRRCHASGLNLNDEVLPLAAYGKFMQGELNGIDILTKGGMVGSADAMSQCLIYMMQKLYM